MSNSEEIYKLKHDLSKHIRRQKLIFEEIISSDIKNEDEMNELIDDMNESIEVVYKSWKEYLKINRNICSQ